MARKVKRLQELQKLFDETEIDFSLLESNTVEEVIKHRGNYVGALKGNQGLLYNDVEDVLYGNLCS